LLIGRDFVRPAARTPNLLRRDDASRRRTVILTNGFGGTDASPDLLRWFFRSVGHDARPVDLGRISDEVEALSELVAENATVLAHRAGGAGRVEHRRHVEPRGGTDASRCDRPDDHLRHPCRRRAELHLAGLPLLRGTPRRDPRRDRSTRTDTDRGSRHRHLEPQRRCREPGGVYRPLLPRTSRTSK